MSFNLFMKVYAVYKHYKFTVFLIVRNNYKIFFVRSLTDVLLNSQ